MHKIVQTLARVDPRSAGVHSFIASLVFVSVFVFTSLGGPQKGVAMMPSVSTCTIVHTNIQGFDGQSTFTRHSRGHLLPVTLHHTRRLVICLMMARLNLFVDSSVSSGGSELYRTGARR